MNREQAASPLSSLGLQAQTRTASEGVGASPKVLFLARRGRAQSGAEWIPMSGLLWNLCVLHAAALVSLRIQADDTRR